MRRGDLLRARAIQGAFVAMVGGLWYAATRTGSVSPIFLPPIGGVAQALSVLLVKASFWSAVAVTARTVLEAYAAAAFAGVGVGYLVTRSRFLTETFEPLLANAFTIPIALFFPLFILFFGLGTASKAAYGALYAFFPIALTTIAGFSSIERRFLWAAKSLGMSRFGLFRHVLLPAAFPVVLSGLRIAFFICFASVLGGEELSANAGIGRNIAYLAQLMDTSRMYAWIAFVVAISVALNLLLSRLDAKARDDE